MSERWAVLRDGVILYGPGPLPYFWTDPDTGDPHEMNALTDAEKAALGWQRVVIRGEKKIIPDVLVEVEPTVTIENGQVVETKNYTFVPKARSTLIELVNDWAEKRRTALAQSRPLQAMIYQQKYEEAIRLQSDPAPIDEDYPLLAASVGIEGATIQDVANVVLATREQWIQAAAAIEKDRMRINKLISDAMTDEEALTIFETNVQ